MNESSPQGASPVTVGLLALAQTAIGAGVGILLAGRIGRVAQRSSAAGLIALGVAATVPVIYDAISRQWRGPDTERGARKRLQSIRNDGGITEHAEMF